MPLSPFFLVVPKVRNLDCRAPQTVFQSTRLAGGIFSVEPMVTKDRKQWKLCAWALKARDGGARAWKYMCVKCHVYQRTV